MADSRRGSASLDRPVSPVSPIEEMYHENDDNQHASPRFYSDRPRPSSHSDDENENIFDDEFAEDYAPSLHSRRSYAPSIRSARSGRSIRSLVRNPFQDADVVGNTDAPQVSPSRPLSYVAGHDEFSIQHRSSIRKSTSENERAHLAALTNRRGDYAFQRSGSTQSPPARQRPGSLMLRTASLASSSSYAPVHTPSHDDSGPSHPYAMYPQNSGISRSASVTTASTARAPSSRISMRGPTHPYALYPQNISNEEGGSSTNVIPVGFPGHAQHYHRRVGADGEEQDLIGSDGHSEQLPPYSRFPDVHAPKVSAGPPLAMIDESLNNEQGLPERDNVEMQGRSMTHPLTQDESNPTPSPRYAGIDAEKDDGGVWRRRFQRKVCGGVPVWVLLMLLAMCIIIAVVCSTVITIVLGNNKPPPSYSSPANNFTPPAAYSQVTVTKTKLVDADPAPTSFPYSTVQTGLPTGVFAVPFSTPVPSTINNRCLTKIGQGHAWACNFPNFDGSSTYNLDVNITQEADGMYIEMLQEKPAYDSGLQPPFFDKQRLTLVYDNETSPGRLAQYFQTYYNKLVVLPHGVWNYNNYKRKRNAAPSSGPVAWVDSQPPSSTSPGGFLPFSAAPPPRPPPTPHSHDGAPPPGPPPGPPPEGYPVIDPATFPATKAGEAFFETPSGYLELNWWTSSKQLAVNETVWFCWWNQTMIEGYLYLDDANDSSYSTTTSAPVVTPSPTSASSIASLASTTNSIPHRTPQSYSTTKSPSSSSTALPVSLPSPTSSTSTSESNYQEGYTNSASASSLHGGRPPLQQASASWPWQNGQEIRKRGAAAVPQPQKKQRRDEIPQYTGSFRLDERRLADTHGTPYCILMTMCADGIPRPRLSNQGTPVGMVLYESDSLAGPTGTGKGLETGTTSGGPQESGQCYCEWRAGS